MLACESSTAVDVLDVLRQIKDARPSAHVVIVGRGGVDEAVAAMRHGADDDLEEPCSAEKLQAVLRRLEQPAATATDDVDDEVANLSLETQGKLLRVLETRQVRKVGDTTEREVDIRLIATTNRSLAEMVGAGAFRADLYYRLNVVPVALPPLRERLGDIPLLATAFLEQFSRQMDVDVAGFSREAMRQMELHPWPGNVRELRNIVERLTVLYGGSRIECSCLPWEIRDAKPSASAAETPSTWDELKRLKREIVRNLERQFLLEALDRHGQNVTQAAESVGMQRTNFHAMLRCHGLRAKGRPDD